MKTEERRTIIDQRKHAVKRKGGSDKVKEKKEKSLEAGLSEDDSEDAGGPSDMGEWVMMRQKARMMAIGI